MFNKLATELGSILLGSEILHIIMGYFEARYMLSGGQKAVKSYIKVSVLQFIHHLAN